MIKALFTFLLSIYSLSAVCQSVLSSGNWHRLATDRYGIYRLSYQKIKQLGINPENARIFHQQKECPVLHRDGYIYFYGVSAHQIHYSPDLGICQITQNVYTGRACFLITDYNTGAANGIITRSAPPAQESVSEGLFTYHHELMTNNLLLSGSRWFGEHFLMSGSQKIRFSCNAKPSGKILVNACVASRSDKEESFVFVSADSEKTVKIPRTYDKGPYAQVSSEVFQLMAQNSENQDITVTFQKNSPSAAGYLDYITIQTTEPLIYRKKQLLFESSASSSGTAHIMVENISDSHIIWDVTEDLPFQLMAKENGFDAETSGRRKFCISSPADALEPEILEKIPNQNIQGLSNVEYLIVTPQIFEKYAVEIARLHPDLNTAVATDQQIYNEFSSGMRDPYAIRNCARHLYNKYGRLKYLLLFGDGSVDNFHDISSNPNLLPTYQSANSLNENGAASFVSDDFYGLLDSGDGEYTGTLDIGIGRLPVKNEDEARSAIAKLQKYLTSAEKNPWRQNILLLADDENYNLHAQHSENIAGIAESARPDLNIRKIYMDAYRQETTSAGDTYPEAKEDLLEALNSGVLIFNYIGHGGMRFFADERILCNDDIDSMKNIDRLPIVVTASCNIGRFDHYDPMTERSDDSPAEHFINNPNGGAIALFTTTREVLASQNHTLNRNLMEELLKPGARLGDVIRISKNKISGDINKLNFILLGDPAIPVALAEPNIRVESVNGIAIEDFHDTLRAMQTCRIGCEISPKDNFGNGTAFITVRDKLRSVSTLNNDGEGVFEYQDFGNVIYKGECTVADGKFSFCLPIPKDISYNPGNLRITMYATSGENISAGYCNSLTMSGSATNATADKNGPQIALSLSAGGQSMQNSLLRIALSDPSGINITGTPGHKITLTVDGESVTDITALYNPAPDSCTHGEILYQLKKLPAGVHSITVKAWDNMNNPSERTITLAVTPDRDLRIYNLCNYPNPFDGETTIKFAHNAPGNVDYTLAVFDTGGRKVWEQKGRLEHGDCAIPLSGRNITAGNGGLYIYVLEITDQEGRTAKDSKKLLFLR